MSAIMLAYRINQLDELARQLQRGPRRLILRRLLGIEFALSVIEPAGAYPFEFIRHAITGVRDYPQGLSGKAPTLLKGLELREGLAIMAEAISTTARLPISVCPVMVSSNQELAERFGVSMRTVTRWRKRGLAAWKLLGNDGRLHTVFYEKAVRRFVAENIGLVRRAANFSQLDQREYAKIIARACELARSDQRTLHSVAVALANETGRGRETIRLILKRYDKEHPKAALFTRREVTDDAEIHRMQIWEAYQDGLSVQRAAARYRVSVSAVYRIVTQMRARALQARQIEYIHDDEFLSPTADHDILEGSAVKKPHAPLPRCQRIPPDLPSYLRELFEIPLLTPEGEAALFRQLNYLKYKADTLRRGIDPENVTAVELDAVDRLLRRAAEVKNTVISSNLRLVVRFAKRHLTIRQDLFELISEGNMALLRAVDLFDFTRGYKFSTYASWAIIRQLAGSTSKSRRHQTRFRTGQDELCEIIPAAAEADHLGAEARELLTRVTDMLSQRQWFVLSRHYGLDDRRSPQTLEQIGKKLGVSKERVRQIESQALGMLRENFAEPVDQQRN